MDGLCWQCKKWTPLDENADSIFLEMVKPSGFAVRNSFGQCLNKKGFFEYEPLPSNRDGAFITRCRFSDIQEAQKTYEKWKEAQQVIQPDNAQ
jgi:hypothetical protein